MDLLEYKGYHGTVEYSAEDECLIGQVIDINGTIGYHGSSLEEIQSDFEGAVQAYLDACEAEGIDPQKPFSGKTVVRMGADLHKTVALRAAEAHTSLNAYIVSRLQEAH